MPAVGLMDVACGLIVLLFPMRALFLHLAVWGLWTASLRPLTGEPSAEFFERAGNFGVPLALLALSMGARPPAWFERVRAPTLDAGDLRRLALTLRLTVASLLIGHGVLAAFAQTGLLARHLAGIGMSGARGVGGFEIALGLAVLSTPGPRLLVFVLAWKAATELLFPLTGAPWWEFVERAGSYAAPAAYALLLRQAPERAHRAAAEPLPS